MPVTVAEKFESRESSLELSQGETIDLLFVVTGTTDDLTAKLELSLAAPTNYNGLSRQSIRVRRLADLVWDGEVRYSTPSLVPEPKQTGDSVFNFDTGGGTHHVTHSKQNVSRTPAPGKTAPDFKGAMGATENGDIEGADITTPVYTFGETHYLAASIVTPTYKAALFNLTGKTNNATFKGFQIGEVLFLGASGSKRGVEDWEVNFKFAASPNATDLVVGNITVPSKKGFEYLWVYYETVEDATAKRLVKRPLAVYVERVYDDGDYSALSIGT